jgi:hypothetical protein
MKKFHNMSLVNNNINHNIIKIGHIGTTTGAYNFEKSVLLIKLLIDKNINIFFNILTQDNPDIVKDILRRFKIPKKNFLIKSVNYKNIEKYINDLNFIIFFLNNNYSIKASFPTKIAEVLLCGKPIICNKFNEDINDIIKNNDFIYGYDNENVNINNLLFFINKILINNKEYTNKIVKFAIDNYENSVSFKLYNQLYVDLINE